MEKWGRNIKNTARDARALLPTLTFSTHSRRGYNLGQRLADDHLARTRAPACRDLRTAADAIARVALKTYLGATATVVAATSAAAPPPPAGGGGGGQAAGSGGGGDSGALSIVIEDSPLADWVDLPPSLSTLSYSALLAGAVRGGLDAVGIPTDVVLTRDAARGDSVTEVRVTPRGAPPAESYPFKDDD